jgi:hypothetical protein
MIALKDDIILHHSLGMPIITMASSVEAYTLNPWNKTNSCNNASPDAPHQSNIPGPKLMILAYLGQTPEVPRTDLRAKHHS